MEGARRVIERTYKIRGDFLENEHKAVSVM